MIANDPDAIVAYANAHFVAQIPEAQVYRNEWSPTPFAEARPAGLEIESRYAVFRLEAFRTSLRGT